MSESRFEFTKDNIDTCLKDVAKEYRKRSGKSTPAELVLIGGASVLINYGFRNMTTDIDAIILASSAMKDAIGIVAERYGLPAGWLNTDFSKTDSYSARLSEYSVFYKTYANIVTVRTIAAEYLIAMKLRSGRQYKNDLSDILGILAEHEKQGNSVTMEQIRKAVIDLYDDWQALPASSRTFIENVMEDGRFEALYEQTARAEKETKDLLVRFEKDYPGVTAASNVDAIAASLQEKTDRASILAMLRERKQS